MKKFTFIHSTADLNKLRKKITRLKYKPIDNIQFVEQ